MNTKLPEADVGVIVGRFQVPELHSAHIDLIQQVMGRHPRVLLFLGVSPCKTTNNNPLDFEARKDMVLEKFPNLNVLYVKDQYSDDEWSKNLDEQIIDLIGPQRSAILYGSRQSFLPYYKGKFTTLELEPREYVSGTILRKACGRATKTSTDFRAGVIWATENQFAVCYPTVDIAIVDYRGEPTLPLKIYGKERILLGRKPTEKLFRFIGGFASVNSSSFEEDARREAFEETRLTLGELSYVGSFLLEDWRFKSEANKPKTLFYIGQYLHGPAIANDDIAEVRWFEIGEIKHEMLMPVHHPLMSKLLS